MLQAFRWIIAGGLATGAVMKWSAAPGDLLVILYGVLELAIAIGLAVSARIGAWMLIAGSLLAVGVSFFDLGVPCGCLGPSADLPVTYRRLIASVVGLIAVLLVTRSSAKSLTVLVSRRP
jgi:hypothetical protein